MQAYSFTSYKIAHALTSAAERGIQVKVILDKSNFMPGQFSQANYLLKNNIPVWMDDELSIAHNKVLIIDNAIIETGSFNYTGAAQYKNAENVLIINSNDLAQQYLQNWEYRRAHSKQIKAVYRPVQDGADRS